MKDEIQEMYNKAVKAFEIIEYWPQEKVDAMVAAVGWEFQKDEVAMDLAKTAVEGSGLGVIADKAAKVKTKTRGTLWDFRGVKTCGIIEEDAEKGLKKFAKPIGVVANVVPCTNPESTVCAIGLSLLKTRNAMIVSPHPRTESASFKAVEYGRKALRKIGAPEDLFLCVKNPSHEKAAKLMATCDCVVATGGAALIKVVYESRKPAQTVGAGNVVSIVDDTVDIQSTAHKIKLSKVANNAASCSSENAIAIYEGIYDDMLEALKKEGAYLCSVEERERLRQTMWPDGHTLNRDVVAKPAKYIAKLANIEVPEDTSILMVIGEKIGPEDMFSGEKLSPVLTVWKWSDFSEMVERAQQILKFSGEGHSISIHTTKEERMTELAIKSNVGRVIVNQPHSYANSGGWGSGLPFTDTLGCGTWAGNISSDNINWRNFLNYTWLATPKKEYVPTDEDLFGPYLDKIKKLDTKGQCLFCDK